MRSPNQIASCDDAAEPADQRGALRANIQCVRHFDDLELSSQIESEQGRLQNATIGPLTHTPHCEIKRESQHRPTFVPKIRGKSTFRRLRLRALELLCRPKQRLCAHSVNWSLGAWPGTCGDWNLQR